MYRLVLGQKIRAQRKVLGVRITSAARASGISRITLIRIERGANSICIDAYIKLCKALGLDLDILKPLGLPMPKIEKNAVEFNIDGAHIRIRDYPQLRSLSWQLNHDVLLTDEEAIGIYGRNKRFLEIHEIQAHERLLMQRLIDECGMEQLL
ncbi:helix-turn-helix domain-containing protein [Polynucleobacter sp. AM-25C3]|jgi:transcriptional regulator with XRE-family HTH domain|uniref:helix-turn-helix domain-containing protein n=1 Tax=Polynucleobacter sp. AM-25C3 TaxID=1855569 RepID=UPI001C0B5F68|nr:helix-turn-helix transcriptional regulator [Polynucleobacter sp. AM-25C3]MBU3602486.1 helix-turn-helix transcriptional regulator [Polynucleobacter sp. AM-25C3]